MISHQNRDAIKKTCYEGPSEALALALRHFSTKHEQPQLQVAMIEPQERTTISANDILRRAISAFG